MSAPTIEDFRALVAAAFNTLDDYRVDAAQHDERMLMHDIAMGRPLAELEWPIRIFAARYCAIDREDEGSPYHPKRGQGRPVENRIRDAIIRALDIAGREAGIDRGLVRRWIAVRAGVTRGHVRRITNRRDP